MYNRAMRKDTLLFISGILVFLTPFLGIPGSWKDILLFVLGFLILLISIKCRFDFRRYYCSEEDILYVENSPEDIDEVSVEV